ncbi:hypothetical protein DACRYDRAFT_25263 [Dacryopinax primogenitus]|uniref:Uncharacterized protein n=1 Tax=Dacryopinax primogenitus (strain DJM 731) TaxID=1858805 RepID=M5G040_DACPD|nr:uncharacterized protein DACRYDRAFT_25263 [Dacryopinax primogenitus]EJT97142.1 hypothetical protein DACRYDRAFT_25263 [Dacryopinax primogenitus]
MHSLRGINPAKGDGMQSEKDTFYLPKSGLGVSLPIEGRSGESSVRSGGTGDATSDIGTSGRSELDRDLLELDVNSLRLDERIAIAEWGAYMRQFPSPSILQGKVTPTDIKSYKVPTGFATDVSDVRQAFQALDGGLSVVTRGAGLWGPLQVAAYDPDGDQVLIRLPGDGYDVFYRFQDAAAIAHREEDRWHLLCFTCSATIR